MNKEIIMNDMNFRNKCCILGLDWTDFEIQGDIIIVRTPLNNLYVFLDKQYNIIEIEKFPPSKAMCDTIFYGYETFKFNIEPEIYHNCNLINFTLKQIIDLSNRVNIASRKHGHSMYIEINGEWYENDSNNSYLQLMHYIKFLAEEVNIYWSNKYTSKMLGFDIPDIYTYISRVICKINECINVNLANNNRPAPVDIMNYIGQTSIYNQNSSKWDAILYEVISLLMNTKGFKGVPGTIDAIEAISEDEEQPQLSLLASNLLTILKVPEEVVLQNKAKTPEVKNKFKVRVNTKL